MRKILSKIQGKRPKKINGFQVRLTCYLFFTDVKFRCRPTRTRLVHTICIIKSIYRACVRMKYLYLYSQGQTISFCRLASYKKKKKANINALDCSHCMATIACNQIEVKFGLLNLIKKNLNWWKNKQLKYLDLQFITFIKLFIWLCEQCAFYDPSCSIRVTHYIIWYNVSSSYDTKLPTISAFE